MGVTGAATSLLGSSEGGYEIIGPLAAVGDGVYAGGGSLEGTVNAFIPGRSGLLVAGEGLESGFGLGLLLDRVLACVSGVKSAGPLKEKVAGAWSELLDR
jgi:hypothetical protein